MITNNRAAAVNGLSLTNGTGSVGGISQPIPPGGKVRAKQVVIAGNGYTGDRLHPAIAGRLLPALSNIIVTRPLTEAEQAELDRVVLDHLGFDPEEEGGDR